MKYLSIDIGGTSAKTGILDENGQILSRASYSVCYDDYRTPILKTVLTETDRFLSEHRLTPSDLSGIGISATGQIDVRTGTVVGSAGHIENWVGSPLKQAFSEKYRLPVSVMNDANCAAIAEQWVGAARGYKNAVIITIGTGIGGGVIVNSSVLEGRLGIAGELGHFSIDKNGIPCTCGNKGCYERYASTSALTRMVKDRYGSLDGWEIFQKLREGDPVIKEIVDVWISGISDGLVSLVHIFNPEIILLGGGVSAQKELFIDKVRKNVLERVMPRFADGLVIDAAALSNDAGMIGAIKPLL